MKRNELLSICNDILTEYKYDGLKLTLRQMYYQLVARGHIANGQDQYKKVGSTLTDARYAGTFPLDGLEDRGRNVSDGNYTENLDCVDDALDQAANYIKSIPAWTLCRDRWLNQQKIVSVWVEKEALLGVFQDPCEELGVSLFACKGYPSISSLHSWYKQMRHVVSCRGFDYPDPEFTVLYFGDHDPDGMEIPESAERNLKKIQDIEYTSLDIEFIRVALNMDQIRNFNPPPFPAKKSSSRFTKYCEEQGTDEAWELDALEPKVLRELIRQEVTERFDDELYSELRKEILGLRGQLQIKMQSDGWLHETFGLE